MYKNICELIKEKSTLQGKGISFIEGEKNEKRITYTDLYQKALLVLKGLQEYGLEPGCELILQIDENEKFLYVFWACMLGGIIAVPVSSGSNTEHLLKVLRIWDRLKNPYLISDKKTLDTLNNAAREKGLYDLETEMKQRFLLLDKVLSSDANGVMYDSQKEDIAFIQFSSGSTGNPKGVVLTHGNLLTNIKAIISGIHCTSEDSSLSWMPLTHDMGLIGFHLSPLAAGINQSLMSTGLFIRRPVLWMDKADEYKATVLSSPNFGLGYFLSGLKKNRDRKWDLSNVRLIFNGAEPISVDLCNQFIVELEPYKLKRNVMFPVYGLAEASLAVTFPPVDEEIVSVKVDRESLITGNTVVQLSDKSNIDGVNFIDLGYPVENCRVRICDEENRLLPENTIGRIQISGENVTKGYYNDQDTTNEIIKADGWLDTGDLGFERNGRLIVTGRAKDIIFVNGQNYYSHDIERICEEFLDVSVGRVAACSAYDRELNEEKITIFILFKGELENFLSLISGLHDHIRKRIGLDIRYILPVRKLPKTTSGKVQRFKLAEMLIDGKFDEVINAMPIRTQIIEENVSMNEIESKLVEICSQVLSIQHIGINDNLMELGGTSILMLRLCEEIAREFKCEIKLSDFTGIDTIAKLADFISNNTDTTVSCPHVMPDNVNTYKPFDLTEVQLAYLLGHDSQFELGGFSTHFYLEIETKLDIQRLNESLQKVIKRHPMLRAIFNENRQQQILEVVPNYNIDITDISNISEDRQLEHIIAERSRMSHDVFEIGHWPLFEFKAFNLSDKSHYLCIGFDMLIADGASIQIMLKELIKYYDNPDVVLPDIEFTFRDYVLAHKDYKNSEKYIIDKNYWSKLISNFPPVPALPLTKDPGQAEKPHYNRISKRIDKMKWKAISETAKNNGIMPSSVLLTAYSKVLSFWSNQDNMAINMTVSNRYPFNEDVYSIIGDFTSVLLVAAELRPSCTFWENASHIQSIIYEALEHGLYDGVELMRELAKKNNTGTKVIMPVVFTCMLFDFIKSDWKEIGDVKYGVSQTPQVYLDNQVMEIDGELSITWDYVEELFHSSTITEMFSQYIAILENLASSQEYRLTPPVEDMALITSYNNTKEEIKWSELHIMFMEQARLTPDSRAVEFEDDYITYSELDEKSNQVARYLKEKGVGINRYVGVNVKRCIETIVNILGVLKAGGAYVPIGPDYPADRKKYILSNSGCVMFLEPGMYEDEGVSEYSKEYFVDSCPGENHIAYTIYTSGSTGKPKGVVISHKAVCNTLVDINRKFKVGCQDRIIGLSSMCFDLSVYDIFGALSTGATLVMIKDQRDVDDIIAVMDKHNITFWNSVPAIMDMLVENLDVCYTNSKLRHVLLSGDWIPVNLPERIRKHFPECEVTSLGGATEASIWSIYYPIREINNQWKSIPYGYPLANQTYYVLNSDKSLCPVGVQGELYIGGDGVAEEYIGDEEKTSNAFIQHPAYGRIYRTGDYGVLHREGYIEFLGRKDHQIKIRGFRIELGEIEAAMGQHPAVQDAVATVYEAPNGAKQLAGYIVPKQIEESEEIPEQTQLLWNNVCEAGKEAARETPEEVEPDTYKEFAALIERLSTGYIYEGFRKLEIFHEPGQEVDIDELIEQKGLKKLYRKLIKQWMTVLVEDGIAEQTGEFSFRTVRALPLLPLDFLWKQIDVNPCKTYWESSFNYLKLCSENILGILRGEVNPLNLLFPEGSWDRAENVYRYNPVATYFNNIAAGVLKAAVKKWPVDKQIRILEFGAGTGGTTASLLPGLPPDRTVYYYTDISSFFTDMAKDVFKDYPFIEYGVYNIDEEPQEQGFTPHSYDVIIGANVLHDAKYLTKTLNHFKSLLTEDGFCLILELTENTRMHKITIGFIEGFSNYDDERTAGNVPLLGPGLWEKAFTKSGFHDFMFFPEENHRGDVYGQHILIARGPSRVNWVRQEEMQEYLTKMLPEYMVPAYIMNIDKIPLSANGKVDRKSLPKPYSKSEHGDEYVPPRNDTERLMCNIWQETLGLKQVGIRDNFFEIGGDSLKAIQISAKAKQHNISLTLNDIYTHLTIEHISKQISGIEQQYAGIEVLREQDNFGSDRQNLYKPFPVTEVQLAYIMGRDPRFELGGTSTHYYVELETNLEIERFSIALNKVIARHPMMRAVIFENGMQQILEKVPEYIIETEDLSEMTTECQQERIVLERERMSHYVFKTDTWPLFDFKAFKLSDKVCYLCLGIDILITDGASIYIIGRELKGLYDNPELEPEKLDFTFRDYIVALDQFKKSESYERDKTYWLSKVDSFPSAPGLPLKQNPADIKDVHFRRKNKVLDKKRWEAIKKKATEKGITPAALLCTAYARVLSYWSNQERFAIDLTVFNRLPFHKDIEHIIGDFTSLILLDINLPVGAGFWQQAKCVQNTLAEALEHRNYDGVEFIREILKRDNTATKAVMPVVFTCALFNDARDGWSQLGTLKNCISQTPQVYLDNQIIDMNGQLMIAWDYVESLFDEEIIDKMFEQYINTILSASGEIADCRLQLNSGEVEIYRKYNATEANLPATTLHGLFIEQAARTPDNIAVIFEEENISYRELDERSNRIARYLAANGVGEGSTVGVVGKRCIGTISNIIGILKAGGAYVPVDPEYPEDRRTYITKNSNCKMLLEPELYMAPEVLEYPGSSLKYNNNTEAIAYIIHTSGSTGKPKGVVIKHRAAANTIIDINRRFNVGEADRIIGLSSMCFDLSVYDIFGALSTGAALVMVRDQRDVSNVIDIIQRHQITFWNSVPAIMDMVVENLDCQFKTNSLRSVLLSGDWIPVKLPEKIRRHFDNASITSLGGATEASIWSIYYPVEEVKENWKSIPYGYPLLNQTYYVMNYEMELCPAGVAGELYIGGAGVAEGYVNDEEKTKNAFVVHPEYGRLYKTGDFGVMQKEGYIEFLGRRDQQVKIRGYRIELGEIQAVIEQFPSILEAVVDVTQSRQGVKQLVGYIVPRQLEAASKAAGTAPEDGILGENTQGWEHIVNTAVEKMHEEPEMKAETYVELWEKIEELSTAYMYTALRKMGVFVCEGEEYSFEQLMENCNITHGYHKLFKQWLDALTESGYLARKGENMYVCSKALPDRNTEEMWKAIKKGITNEDLYTPLEYLKLSSSNHIGMLRGEVNPLTLFFPKGSTETAQSIYRFNPIAKYINNIAGETLKAAIETFDENRLVRILEVGAGTGGTTATILPLLPEERVSYTFTDLSTFFTGEAQERFKKYPFMKYGIFDINEEPQGQGFQLGSFDIIIGANVLHDARNIDRTLKYIRTLLAPQGKLYIVEGTRNTRQQMVSVGFIEGFSHFEDERIKDNLPLLPVEGWERAMLRSGFERFAAFPEKGYRTEVFNQHVIITEAPNTSLRIDQEELKSFIGSKLPDYMIPSQFIQLDSIPLTNNGKVDRKALPKPEDISADRSDYVPPRNEAEEKIAAIWSEVLEVDKVGIHDDFFEIGGDSLKAIKAVSRLGVFFDIDLNKFFNGATIASLAEGLTVRKDFLKNKLDKITGNIDLSYEGRQMEPDFKEALEKYRQRNMFYYDLNVEEKENYSNILLAGATGFLGIHLFHELLENTGYRLHLLVRGKTTEDAKRRLIDKYKFYFNDRLLDEHESRIEIYNGDIAIDNFDLTQEQYEKLATDIDCIQCSIGKTSGQLSGFPQYKCGWDRTCD